MLPGDENNDEDLENIMPSREDQKVDQVEVSQDNTDTSTNTGIGIVTGIGMQKREHPEEVKYEFEENNDFSGWSISGAPTTPPSRAPEGREWIQYKNPQPPCTIASRYGR